MAPTTSNSQTTNSSANNVDNSLYSPSSSTSLLYHIYDQINLPSDHQQAYNTNNNTNSNNNNNNNNNIGQPQARTSGKPANTTTILNPADLFGVMGAQHQQQPQVIPQPQIATSTTLQLHHQQQQQQHQAEFLQRQKLLHQQQQQLYSAANQYHLQPPSAGFGTLHQNANSNHDHNNNATLHHLNATGAGATYLGAAAPNQQALDANDRMVLDSMIQATATLHQQQLANTLARKHHLGQHHQQLTYHARPISSSGASSMSGQSMAVAYGRQPRPASSSKSQANLSSVLHSSQTLDYLGLGSAGVGAGLTSASCSSGSKKLAHFSGSSPAASFMSCKRAKQRLRRIAYEYSTMLKCFGLLVLLALGLMSIIKLALVSQQAANGNSSNNQANAVIPIPSNNNGVPSSNNQLVYPFKYPDQPAASGETGDPGALLGADGQQSASSSDDLKSRLLIGEFVVTSQNYSHSAAHRSLLAENLVKLMDQVFLSSPAVRHFYSRMEVTNIRPNRTSGLVVDCNIILSESIAYAAQQFGIALYESLTKSNEKLANQASFVIDKNSIRFNTVPDKDLKAGMLPPGLISASVSRELLVATMGGQPVAPAHLPDMGPPSGGLSGPSADNSMAAAGGDPLELANSVVWSEWSQWSSCVDKNGFCDPQRLHSRLRKCLAQHTGDKVDASQCKQRFNIQDQELEVADCSQACQGQPLMLASPMSSSPMSTLDSHLMSDEPIGPQTAPSVLLNGNEPASFLMPPPPQLKLLKQHLLAGKQQQADLNSISMAASSRITMAGELVEQQQQQQQQQDPRQQPLSSSTVATTSVASADKQPGDQPLAPGLGLINLDQQQLSCSNCTSDEICLLLVQQKVPFCAKIKDRQDESGCGGWCKAQPGQLCQPVGQNAFKCILDSECLANEWRCHNSACIPLDKRCDGHYNCYDNSDERDCPIKS